MSEEWDEERARAKTAAWASRRDMAAQVFWGVFWSVMVGVFSAWLCVWRGQLGKGSAVGLVVLGGVVVLAVGEWRRRVGEEALSEEWYFPAEVLPECRVGGECQERESALVWTLVWVLLAVALGFFWSYGVGDVVGSLKTAGEIVVVPYVIGAPFMAVAWWGGKRRHHSHRCRRVRVAWVPLWIVGGVVLLLVPRQPGRRW